MKINLEIDQLVLDGFNQSNYYGLGVAIEQEISRLIGRKGLGNLATRQITSTGGGSFKMKEGITTRKLGVLIAREIYYSFMK